MVGCQPFGYYHRTVMPFSCSNNRTVGANNRFGPIPRPKPFVVNLTFEIIAAGIPVLV